MKKLIDSAQDRDSASCTATGAITAKNVAGYTIGPEESNNMTKTLHLNNYNETQFPALSSTFL